MQLMLSTLYYLFIILKRTHNRQLLRDAADSNAAKFALRKPRHEHTHTHTCMYAKQQTHYIFIVALLICIISFDMQ